MFSTPSQFSLLSPTVFYLDEEVYRQASRLNDAIDGSHDSSSWKKYLNCLGRLALTDWLGDNGLRPSIPSLSHWEEVSFLEVEAFRLCVMTCENSLSEVIHIPGPLVDEAAIAAHFYAFLEVNEELDEVWFRGLIRQDQVLQWRAIGEAQVTIPLATLEPDLTRLIHYCQYLESDSIPLPQASVQATQEAASSATAERLRTKLNTWLDDVVTQGWQAWDLLQPQLAYATRGLADGIKQGKLVNVGLEIDQRQLALVLTLKPQADERISILVQLLPTGNDRTLPPNVELAMLSSQGNIVQSVTSRRQDNYIQLKTFRGSIGQQFSLRIRLDDSVVSEEFEI